jgi:4-hydroxymandelate oxidase
MIDSDFRRGTDVCKALFMGATAVAVGRLDLWGLGAFGQPGVERVLERLRAKLSGIMRQLGSRSVRHLAPVMVRA